MVEQKVGAGGRIAVTTLKAAAPDGLTLLLSPSSMFTIYPHVFKRLQYKPTTDAIAVSPVALSTCGFMVGPKVPEAARICHAQHPHPARGQMRQAVAHAEAPRGHLPTHQVLQARGCAAVGQVRERNTRGPHKLVAQKVRHGPGGR